MKATLHIAVPPISRPSTLQLQPFCFPLSFSRFEHRKLPFNVSSSTNVCRASSSRVGSRQMNRSLEVGHHDGGCGDDDGITVDYVKTLTRFNSEQNCIRVLEVSRKTDHHFAGSRLLLLDPPGNIHSASFLLKTLTDTYFDVSATLPPVLPPGPISILGFGAGSAARVILKLYPGSEIHGWELDPCVVSVGREYFGLSELEKRNWENLFVYIRDALEACLDEGFSGILVDLFSKGQFTTGASGIEYLGEIEGEAEKRRKDYGELRRKMRGGLGSQKKWEFGERADIDGNGSSFSGGVTGFEPEPPER